MSLISDALKKARQEAARQDALRQGMPYAVGAADPPARNPWLPLAAGLGAGCLLAAVVFLFAWTAGWGPFAAKTAAPAPTALPQVAQAPQPTPAVTIEEQPPAVPPRAVPQAAIPEVTTAPPPLPEPVRPQPEPPVQPVQEAPPAPSIQVTPSNPTPAPQQQPEPAPETAPAPPAPVQEDPAKAEAQSFVREVPVPGGGTLTLNGIAYSPDRPIAVVDGKVIGPGEVVQGFTVVEIQANRLKLQGHGTTVYVSLK
ncbi:MAG: hypothetical protein ACJ75H_03565 [Thermoanaerobaculia bacterium]